MHLEVGVMELEKELFKVTKILNNNVIMVQKNLQERIFVGCGIGFGIKSGDDFRAVSRVEKVFTIEKPEYSEKFEQLIKNAGHQIIGLCEEAIHIIAKELNEKLNERIHIALSDHIQFMLYRLRNKNDIANPFIIEIQMLYKKEYKIAQKVVKFLHKETNLEIPEEETGFVALHINSARKNCDLTTTLKFTFLCNSITVLIEDELKMVINKNSLDYARFLIHIRFAIRRIIDGISLKNELLAVIKSKMNDFYKIAKKVAGLIEEDSGLIVDEDEIGYITLHIARINLTKDKE